MRIAANRDRCTSSGSCVRLAPEVFDQSEEDGAVEVLTPEPSALLWAAVREAAMLCPVRAITLTE